jgi:hypothetical protein
MDFPNMKNPFPGATELLINKKEKKKLKKILKRGNIVCTCGALDIVWTKVSFLHDDDCIINSPHLYTKKGRLK